MTGHLLYPIYNVVSERVNLNDIITNDFIDKIYEQTVEALLTSSDWCINAIPQHTLKYWWTSDLSNLKKQSIASHSAWLAADRPRSGALFETKNKDKLRYKFEIRKAKNLNNDMISDKLHEALVYKDSICFWKTWKHKVCTNSKGKVRIEGNLSPQDAVDKFANFFEKVTSPNSPEFNREKKPN